MTTDYEDSAGQWYSWCADCGTKNHKTNHECRRCRSSAWVQYRSNVGKPEYTTGGTQGADR